MYIYSFKINKARIIAFFIMVACIGMAIGLLIPKGQDKEVLGKAPKNLNAATEEERIAFLIQFGWEVEFKEEQEVLIPEEFDPVYERYNALQKKENGLNLKKYKGKTVTRYTYSVENYPDKDERVYANILVYNGKVIGGDICSVALDGFMYGFKGGQNT